MFLIFIFYYYYYFILTFNHLASGDFSTQAHWKKIPGNIFAKCKLHTMNISLQFLTEINTRGCKTASTFKLFHTQLWLQGQMADALCKYISQWPFQIHFYKDIFTRLLAQLWRYFEECW